MNRKSLTVDDRRAVDLILDRAAAHRSASETPADASVAQPNLSAVKRLLSMLDTLPAIDPPEGLAARTLVRVSEMGNVRIVQPALAALPTLQH